MVLGLDARLLLLGVCLGGASVYLNTLSLVPLSTLLGSSLKLTSHTWATAFHRVQHAVPFFPDHDHELARQQEPPIQAMSPVQQRQIKQQEEAVRTRSQRRVPAPVYLFASDAADTTTLERIKHELNEHILPRGLLLVSSASELSLSLVAGRKTSVEISDRIGTALQDGDVYVSSAEHRPSHRASDLLSDVPTMHLAIPANAKIAEITRAGAALHPLLDEGIAILIDSPAVQELGKVVDAAIHYIGSDRARSLGSYASPLLLFAAAAAGDREGEALQQSGSSLLLRFGHVDDHGPDIL